MRTNKPFYDKIVYLLQGGGALGAYQVGVCQRLLDENWQPNWIIGTSIGAINAAIIAGNDPDSRSEKLQSFWDIISASSMKSFFNSDDLSFRKFENYLSSEQCLLMGQPGFFQPRKGNPWLEVESTPDKISFYDIRDLKKTLMSLVDFDRLNNGDIRITMSAMCLDEGVLARFDSRDTRITVDHVMASAALPPGFPAIEIQGKYYWDGGLSSNTPLTAILEETECENLLCFMVDLFANHAPNPKNMMDVLKRKKDLEFASRYHRMLHYFCEAHKLHSALAKLCEEDPSFEQHPALAGIHLHHPCSLNIVRFHYQDKPYELWSKDFDFSVKSITERREAGYIDVEIALKDGRWCHPLPGERGVLIHEYYSDNG